MAVLLYAGTSDTANGLQLAKSYRGAPDSAESVTVTITTVYVHDLLDLAGVDETLIYSLGINTGPGANGVVALNGRTRYAAHPEISSEPAPLDLQRGFLRLRPRIVQYRDRDSFLRALKKNVSTIEELWKKAEAWGITEFVQDAIDKAGGVLDDVWKQLIPAIGLPEKLVLKLLEGIGRTILDAIFRDAVALSDSIDLDLTGTSMGYARFRRGYYVSAYTDEGLTHPEKDDINLAPEKWRLSAGFLVPPRPHKKIRGYMVFRVG